MIGIGLDQLELPSVEAMKERNKEGKVKGDNVEAFEESLVFFQGLR